MGTTPIQTNHYDTFLVPANKRQDITSDWSELLWTQRTFGTSLLVSLHGPAYREVRSLQWRDAVIRLHSESLLLINVFFCLYRWLHTFDLDRRSESLHLIIEEDWVHCISNHYFIKLWPLLFCLTDWVHYFLYTPPPKSYGHNLTNLH